MNSELIHRVAARTMRWNFRTWGFGEGVALRGLLDAHRVTGSAEYFGFVYALLRVYIGRGVAVSNEDHVAPGRELLFVYEQTGEEDFLVAAKKLAAMHTRFSSNKHGARMHRPDLPGWRKQIWVDCMEMDAPFLARLGRLTGEEEYYAQAAEEITAYARCLQDEATGLFFHGWEEDCGSNGQLWARGNGWALMGLIETLKLLPKADPHRGELLDRLQSQCRGLRRLQDGRGLWHTVINHSETYLESSLAVMVAYALREMFTAGLLSEREFGDMERRARGAAMRLVSDNGALELVSDATPIAELKMYATRPFGVFPWGQGPLLLMLCQDMRYEI
ncbi:MAG: glycoside hydrolase family 88 protein [Acidobacteria bacterium]|nr:glycoside hydrolase family 88 protein [Acidobacteriota bacterium]